MASCIFRAIFNVVEQLLLHDPELVKANPVITYHILCSLYVITSMHYAYAFSAFSWLYLLEIQK